MKVTVSRRALLARINRKLSAEQMQMRQARQGTRLNQGVGDFYILDLSRNAVHDTYCNLEEWGKKLGAIAPFEVLEG